MACKSGAVPNHPKSGSIQVFQLISFRLIASASWYITKAVYNDLKIDTVDQLVKNTIPNFI